MAKSKLTNCKVCGAEIAKSAKSCPNCGAKCKKKHPILIGLLILLVVAIVVNALNSNSKKKSVDTSSITDDFDYTPSKVPSSISEEKAPEAAPIEEPETPPIAEPDDADESIPSSESTGEVSESPTAPAGDMRPEFKEALDSYEAFFDEYCAFMNEFAEDSSNPKLIAKYSAYLLQYSDTMKKWTHWMMGK